MEEYESIIDYNEKSEEELKAAYEELGYDIYWKTRYADHVRVKDLPSNVVYDIVNMMENRGSNSFWITIFKSLLFDRKKKMKERALSFKTKSRHGFNDDELDQIKLEFQPLDEDKFNWALTGITCVLDNGEVITYPYDVYITFDRDWETLA